MKRLFNSSIFLFYLFILFFVIINIYLVFQIDTSNLFNSYVTLYISWFLIILILKLISNYINLEGNEDV